MLGELLKMHSVQTLISVARQADKSSNRGKRVEPKQVGLRCKLAIVLVRPLGLLALSRKNRAIPTLIRVGGAASIELQWGVAVPAPYGCHAS